MGVSSQYLKLGLLGKGISRSRARYLHELIGEILGLPVTYEPMDLGGAGTVSIADELERCREQGFSGVNVTHPFKSEAFAAVAHKPSLPAGLTSINTVLFNREPVTGANTDYSGFCRGFRATLGDAVPGRVLMMGTGGVGKAIACALHTLGADELVVHDTNAAAAAGLVAEMARTGMAVRVAGADLAAEMRASDGLVNATPLGMHQYPGSAFPPDDITGQRWAFDAVYTPENTEFLQTCRQRGIATISGFKLFLYQGLDAFELFSGLAVDGSRIEPAFLERYPLE